MTDRHGIDTSAERHEQSQSEPDGPFRGKLLDGTLLDRALVGIELDDGLSWQEFRAAFGRFWHLAGLDVSRRFAAVRAAGRLEPRRERLLLAVEDELSTPLALLALLLFPLLIVDLLLHLPWSVAIAVHVAEVTVWVAFAVDFLVRLRLARRRVRYALRFWPYTVALVVPPVLAVTGRFDVVLIMPLIALILARALLGVRRVEVTEHLWGLALVIAVLFSALASLVYSVERDAGGTITSFGDALWWSLVTATTIGYGDEYPATVAGRLLAIPLIVVGVAIFALFIGLIGRKVDRPDGEPAPSPTSVDIPPPVLGPSPVFSDPRRLDAADELLAQQRELGRQLEQLSRQVEALARRVEVLDERRMTNRLGQLRSRLRRSPDQTAETSDGEAPTGEQRSDDPSPASPSPA